MTQFLIFISAMLGTLTQAICCPTVINVDPKGWMCVLSAFNQATMREEFFAWQDAREQERLDAIMDQPVEPPVLYNICDDDSWIEAQLANFEAGNGSLLTVEEWQATLDQPVDGVYIPKDAEDLYYESDEFLNEYADHMEAKVWEEQAWKNLYKECLDAAFDRVIFEEHKQALNERAMLEDGLAQQAQWQLDWDYQEGAEQTSQKFALLKFMIEWQQCHLVTCEELELTKQEVEESLVEYEDWTDWEDYSSDEDDDDCYPIEQELPKGYEIDYKEKQIREICKVAECWSEEFKQELRLLTPIDLEVLYVQYDPLPF